MEAELQIICGHNSPQEKFHKNSNWFSNILDKLRELTSPDKGADEDWEIPFERIRMRHNDFQRCGSQGDVFYGRLGYIPVAVKRVKDVSLTKIRHLRELDHKNIIRFLGISQNSNYYYIIMEWCPYETLDYHIHNGRQLSATILGNFTQQIASGMKYLHSKNIIHRDLKPSNVLLTHHDVLKISDFGTHKISNGKIPVTSISYAGTHAYMAPEVIRSEPYSFPVDVWSYGIVLWEILTGEVPYKNIDSSAVVWAVGNNSYQLPIPHSLPQGFSRILTGCWRPKPSDRLSFAQIDIILKGAVPEIDKIRKDHWLPLQAEWKKEVKDELNKNLKNDQSDDQPCCQKIIDLDEALERAYNLREKNTNMYLKLQECYIHIQRERDELFKREQELIRREKELAQREQDLAKKDKEAIISNDKNNE